MKAKYLVILILVIGLLVLVKYYLFGSKVVSVGCKFSVRVAGNTMEPTFKEGNLLFPTKCFGESDLKENVIVIYKLGDGMAMGRIYKIENNNYYVRGDNVMATYSERITHGEEIIGIISD